jgi:limonene-1,2-epoxide hydrolase
MQRASIHALLILLATLLSHSVYASEETAVSANEQTIRQFIAAWSKLDAKELAGYFSEDGIYHNMPSDAVRGRDNIEQFIAGFIRPWQSTDWEIVSLLAEGNVVMVERLDKTVVAGNPVNLPCFGYFELENGKIRVWRDYFDLATYTSALGASMQTGQQQ